MQDEKVIAHPKEQEGARSKTRPFPRTASHERFSEPEPILDPTSIMEQQDRGEGMGVDDEKTYHRTER